MFMSMVGNLIIDLVRSVTAEWIKIVALLILLPLLRKQET